MIDEETLRKAKLKIPEGMCLSVVLPDEQEILFNLSNGSILKRSGVHLFEDDLAAREAIREFVRRKLLSHQLRQAREKEPA